MSAEDRILRLLYVAGRPVSGADIHLITRVGPGRMYPALLRFERDGLVEMQWGDGPKGGRAGMYRLTWKGQMEALRRKADAVFVPAQPGADNG